jgi:Xaa-Pro aminopeptidase
MLTAEGCRRRRQRLVEQLRPGGALVLTDPIHLAYLANFWVDPISLGAGFGGCLVLRPDGLATLFHEDRLPGSVAAAHVDRREVVPWYDGQSPGRGPRQLALSETLRAAGCALTPDDHPSNPRGEVTETLAAMRRRKDPDEVALLRRCIRAAEAGHAWARTAVEPGMTELDVYCGVLGACTRAAGQPVIVYGDFAVSPGPERRGGPPTGRVLRRGDLFILDFSVVIGGYRGDFTNTLAVGREPRDDQRLLERLCLEAMAAGERALWAGAMCRAVHGAVAGVFEREGMAEHFGHHAGHGLGLTHPEAPYFVRHATETLLEGDVVTLEPGLYVPGVGGLRIEHNYLVTDAGPERLSDHVIGLT